MFLETQKHDLWDGKRTLQESLLCSSAEGIAHVDHAFLSHSYAKLKITYICVRDMAWCVQAGEVVGGQCMPYCWMSVRYCSSLVS